MTEDEAHKMEAQEQPSQPQQQQARADTPKAGIAAPITTEMIQRYLEENQVSPVYRFLYFRRCF